jgi:hypothetical protein
MTDVINKRCDHPGCATRPVFGFEWGNGLRCSKHRLDGMINVVDKRCDHPGCITQPIFGFEWGNGLKCFEHKLEGMIDVKSKRCEQSGCMVRPVFGYELGHGLRCFEHRLDGMTNVKDKRCEHPECIIYPVFGYELGHGLRCLKHKVDGMINVKNKRCEHPECTTQPIFGFEWGCGLRCLKHKVDKMMDVIHKRCEHPGCTIQPSYGPRWGQRVRCFKHKLDGMVDVMNRRCEYLGCDTRPSFGYENGQARFCVSHKFDGMIDIKSDRCLQSGCTIRPSYCKLFSPTKTYCREHATLNDYSVSKRSPICSMSNCNDRAVYIDREDINIYPARCESHKLLTDVKLTYRRCLNCEDELYFPENKEVCMNCGVYREKHLYHFKEQIVRDFLQTNGVQFAHDKRINIEGSSFRPDFIISTKFGCLVVEVDEYQHKREGYDPLREENRMRVIYQDVQLNGSSKQVLFLRFNPDQYDGPKIDMKLRLDYLHTVIRHFEQTERLDVSCGKIYLYYDGFTGQTMTIQPIEMTTQVQGGDEPGPDIDEEE